MHGCTPKHWWPLLTAYLRVTSSLLRTWTRAGSRFAGYWTHGPHEAKTSFWSIVWVSDSIGVCFDWHPPWWGTRQVGSSRRQQRESPWSTWVIGNVAECD